MFTERKKGHTFNAFITLLFFVLKEVYLHLLQSAPTNKLLYAKDIPQFKEEVRSFYKDIRDAPSLSSTELTEFLTSESKVFHEMDQFSTKVIVHMM